jgi:glycine cleavage system T protein (aminomethyltransferase)
MGRRTQVYQYHKDHGNIVDYAGFELPVWYEGIIPECKRVRNQAGIFDVSHMGRVLAEGPDAGAYLDRLTTNDVTSLAVGTGHYSLMCNPHGGIIDDLTIFHMDTSKFLVVYNAGNRDKNWKWLQENKSPGVHLSDISDTVAMFAIQGPKAEDVLRDISGISLDGVERYAVRDVKVDGVGCFVTKSGYTGEDGFEIYVWKAPLEDPRNALTVWNKILAQTKYDVGPVGLGARDVLRLEAGMCLYGNDIDEETSPVEAKLNWVVRLSKGPFIGKEAIEKLKESGPSRVRVGFKMLDKGIPRHGQEIRFTDSPAGKVTSGTLSPTLGQGVGMGFVKPSLATQGRELEIRIRDRSAAAEVVKLPFYQRRSPNKVTVFGEDLDYDNFKEKFG